MYVVFDCLVLQDLPNLPSVQCDRWEPGPAQVLPQPALREDVRARGQTTWVPDRRDLLCACKCVCVHVCVWEREYTVNACIRTTCTSIQQDSLCYCVRCRILYNDLKPAIHVLYLNVTPPGSWHCSIRNVHAGGDPVQWHSPAGPHQSGGVCTSHYTRHSKEEAPCSDGEGWADRLLCSQEGEPGLKTSCLQTISHVPFARVQFCTGSENS